jgi:hypothetical protein
MSTTLTFSGVTNPAGSASAKATFGMGSSLPTPPSGTEATTGNYTALASADGSDWSSSVNDQNGKGWHLFRFPVTLGPMSQLYIVHKGAGNDDQGSQNGIALYIYVPGTGWGSAIASHSNSTDTQITATLTSSLSQYRDSNGYVWILARGGRASEENDGWIRTDFASLEITYATPTMTGFSPSSGTNAGGTVVTITGSNYTGATWVTFGSSNATSFTVDSDTQIRAVTPAFAGSAGVNVGVSGPGGSVATGTYTYLLPCVFGGVTYPSSGNKATWGMDSGYPAKGAGTEATTQQYGYLAGADNGDWIIEDSAFRYFYQQYAFVLPAGTLAHLNVIVRGSAHDEKWGGNSFKVYLWNNSTS